jgi:hypothetical protein
VELRVSDGGWKIKRDNSETPVPASAAGGWKFEFFPLIESGRR